MLFLIALLISVGLLLVAIIKFDIHPFFVLVLCAILYGLIVGMDLSTIVASINDGFGGLLGKVGLVIIFGVAIGSILEKSGGALVIANKVLSIIGEKAVHLAMMICGFILSIPVFADSAFIIMNPLNKALSAKAGAAYAGTTAALACGLMAAHVLVPPTPGPIAAAAVIGADLGQVILWGLIVSSLALVSCYFFSKTYASKITIPITLEKMSTTRDNPPFWKSILAIIIPIVLIIIKSVSEYPTHPFGESKIVEIFQFIGTPTIALLIGLFLALLIPEKWDKKIIASGGWMGDAIKSAAPILLITGAGGIFGKMIQNSGITDLISSGFSFVSLQLFFPFLLAAILKTAQGSSTVAIITTASIVAPLLSTMGIDGDLMKVYTVLAIGAGSLVTSHVNDSFFWILTQLTGMNVRQGNQVLTVGAALCGVSAMLVIFIFSLILG